MIISAYFGLSFRFDVKIHNSLYPVLYFPHTEQVSFFVNVQKMDRKNTTFPIIVPSSVKTSW